MPKIERGFELERIVFFSDAVFAIALTLLVVDLPLPELAGAASDGQFRAALAGAIPNLTAFFISFWVVAVYWLAHHRSFRWIVRWDTGLMLRNLLFLFFIAILPWPTRILAEMSDFPSAVALYAACMIAIGLASFELWRYATVGAGLVGPNFDRRVYQMGVLRIAGPVTVFALSIPLAYVNTSAAQYFWLTLIPFEWASDRYAKSIGTPDSSSSESLEAALRAAEGTQEPEATR